MANQLTHCVWCLGDNGKLLWPVVYHYNTTIAEGKATAKSLSARSGCKYFCTLVERGKSGESFGPLDKDVKKAIEAYSPKVK